MSDNSPTQSSRIFFFISRLFILAGMVMVFSSLFYVIGSYLCKWIYEVDFFTNPSLLSGTVEDIYVIRALKFLQVCITIGAMIIPAWYFPKAISYDPASFLKTKSQVPFLYIVLAIAVIFISVPFVSWLININEGFKFPAYLETWEAKLKAAEDAATRITQLFVAANSIPDLIGNLFVLALLPAIAEELLFRGALQQFIQVCFKNRHAAVISSAIIFSAFHGQFYGFLPRFVLGMLLGYLVAYGGNIWPAVVAHFTNNAMTVLISYFHWDVTGPEFLKNSYRFPVHTVLLSAAFTVIMVYLMYHKRQKQILYNGE